jgi:hypothetical protein
MLGRHSMTSSARANNVGGTASQSAFAVLRLIASSYFDRLALAEYYLQLAESELAASRRIAGQTIQEKPDAATHASASGLPPGIADGITKTSAVSL